MSELVPASHKDLIEGPILVSCATIMPDGQPQLSVIWCNMDSNHILMNTARGRQKERNIAGDPRLTLMAVDPEDPYRYIEVRGKVVEVTEEGANAHIDALARIYTSYPAFYGYVASEEQRRGETRIMIRIKPTRVRIQG